MPILNVSKLKFNLIIFIGGFYLKWSKLYIASDSIQGEDIPFGFFDLSWNNKMLIELE